MFWASGNGTRAFTANAFLERSIAQAHVDALGFRRQSHISAHVRAVADQLCFAGIPRLQHLLRRSAAEDSRVDEAGKSNTRNMTRGAIDALEVPDGFGTAAVNQQGLHSLATGCS